jgi:hypothetical protein
MEPAPLPGVAGRPARLRPAYLNGAEASRTPRTLPTTLTQVPGTSPLTCVECGREQQPGDAAGVPI